jgi:PAS domain S-box-containing protein
MDDICGAMIQLDKDGVVTSWNDSASEILGFDKDAVIGTNAMSSIFINDVAKGGNILNVIETGEVYYSFDEYAQNSEGHMQPVSLVVSPLCEGGEEVTGVTILVSNVLLI